MIYEVNPARAPGARQSELMNFSHADQADTRLLNAILWRDAMGNRPLPAVLKHPGAMPRRDDDD